jgi:Zn-dependent alcohol dehydrogenase
MEGRLLLDEMISKQLSLEEINDGFDASEKGDVARSL